MEAPAAVHFGCSDSLASCLTEQTDEPALELTSRLKACDQNASHHPSKRRRVEQQVCSSDPGCGSVEVRTQAAAARSELPPCAAAGAAAIAAGNCSLGGLGCSEAHDCLEDADCSSVETQEGFVVYQSPLSLAAQRGDSDGAATGAPAPPPALAEQLPPQLAGDPDLAEMLSVLCDSEAEQQPSSRFMEQHGPAISPELYLDASMRRTAASWLVEVATEFGLHQETLFLATALLDRFLSATKGVPRTQLQLVAVACMLIASKHEEEMHPSVLDFTNIADNCFMPGDLLRMEAIVLDCLSFRINTPTAHTFLSMYKQAMGLQPRTCALASYLAELAMLEYDLLHFRPSHVASAATLLAQLYMNDTQSLSHLLPVTRYSVDALKPCLRRLLALQRAAHVTSDYASPYLPVRDKYRGPQWLSVGCTTPFASAAALAAELQPFCSGSGGGGNGGGCDGKSK